MARGVWYGLRLASDLGPLCPLEGDADLFSGGLQFGPRRLSLPLGGQSEPISVIARYHVEMGVEDRLVGGFAVEVEEVDAVAAKVRSSC